MRLTIKTKLATTFVVVVAMSAVGIFMGIQNLGTLDQTMSELLSGPVDRSIILKDMQYEMAGIGSNVGQLLLSTDAEEIAELGTQIDGEFSKVSENASELVGQFVLAKSNEDMQSIVATLDRYRDALNQVQEEAAKNSAQTAFSITTSRAVPRLPPSKNRSAASAISSPSVRQLTNPVPLRPIRLPPSCFCRLATSSGSTAIFCSQPMSQPSRTSGTTISSRCSLNSTLL